MATLKNLTINDTGYLQIPSGTIAQRPASPSRGMMRYNTDFKVNEYYNGTEWVIGSPVPIITDGLVVWLDAAEPSSYPGSGTTWTDLSGSGNNGTLANGPTFTTTDGGGFVFDGSDDVLNISNSTSLQNTFSTGSFSITSVSKATNLVYPRSSFPFWIQNYALNNTWAIANRGMSSGDGSNETSYTIEVNNGGTYFAGSVNHTVSLSVSYVRTIVIDRTNGFTFKYYINGVFLGESASTSITGSIYDSGGFQFGNMYGWTFNGTLYNLLINSKALTSAEVQQNYQALRGRFGL
jgi:hypothetical protein